MLILEIEQANEFASPIINKNTIQVQNNSYSLDILVSNYVETSDHVFVLGNKIQNFMKGGLVLVRYAKESIPSSNSICFQQSDYHHMDVCGDKLLILLDQTYIFNLNLELLFCIENGEHYFYKNGFLQLVGSKLLFLSPVEPFHVGEIKPQRETQKVELRELKTKKLQLEKYNEMAVNGKIKVINDLIHTRDRIIFETNTRELAYYFKTVDLEKYLGSAFAIDAETKTKVYQYQYLQKKEKDTIDLDLLEKTGYEFKKREIKSSAKSITSIKKLLNYGAKHLSLGDTIDQILDENYSDLYMEMNDQLEIQILLDRLKVFEEIYIKSFINIEKEYDLFLDFGQYCKKLAAENNNLIYKLLPFCNYEILEFLPLYLNILFKPKSKKEYYFKIFHEESDFMEDVLNLDPLYNRIEELRKAGLYTHASKMIDYYLQDLKFSAMIETEYTLSEIQQMTNQELIEKCENVSLLKVLNRNEQLEFMKVNIEKGNMRMFIDTELFGYLVEYFNDNDVDIDFDEWSDILSTLENKVLQNGSGWDLHDDWDTGKGDWDTEKDKVESTKDAAETKILHEKFDILLLFHSFGFSLNFYKLKPEFVKPLLDKLPLDKATLGNLQKANEIIKIDQVEFNTVLYRRLLQEKKFNLLEIIKLPLELANEIKTEISIGWFDLDQLGNKHKNLFKDILSCKPPRNVVELVEIAHEFIHHYNLKMKPKDLRLQPLHYLQLVVSENSLYHDIELVTSCAKKLGLHTNVLDLCARISMEKKDFVIAYQLLLDSNSGLVSELILNDEFEDTQAKLLLACSQDDMQLFNHAEQIEIPLESFEKHDFYNSVGGNINDNYTKHKDGLDIKIAQLLESNDFEYQVQFFEDLPKTPENISLASYFFNLKAYISSNTPFALCPEPFPGDNEYKQQALIYQSKIKSVESKHLLESLGLTENNLEEQLVKSSKTVNKKVFDSILKVAQEYNINLDLIVSQRVLYLVSKSDLQPLSEMTAYIEYFPEIDINQQNDTLLFYYNLTNTHQNSAEILKNLKEKDLDVPLDLVLRARNEPDLFIEVFNDYCKFLPIKDFIHLFGEWMTTEIIFECVKLFIDNIPWITLDKDTAEYLVRDLVGINDLQISEYLFFKTVPGIIADNFDIKPELKVHYELLAQSDEKYQQQLNLLYKRDKTAVFMQMIQDDLVPDIGIGESVYKRAIQQLVETRQFEKLQLIQSKYLPLIKEIMKTQPGDVKLILLDLLDINDETERLVSVAKAIWDIDAEGSNVDIIQQLVENTTNVSQAVHLLKFTDSQGFIDKLTDLGFDLVLMYLSLKKLQDYTRDSFHRFFYGIYTNDKQIIKEFVQLPMHQDNKLLYQLLIIRGYFGFDRQILDMISGEFEYILGCILLTKCDYKIKILKKIRGIPDGMFNGLQFRDALGVGNLK
ncbi:hypothetical protein HDV01_005432 [Terramyces sp. JEL0728]|nr:hypothetical protein HDV01_005432 [Terramyces sp. JEL0728]